MIDRMMQTLRPAVRHRVWIFSDLQQSLPEKSHYCLRTAVDDFKSLNLKCEQIWYLGDAVEGSNLQNVETMASMQMELLQSLQTPVRYVLGNHDLDLFRSRKCGAESAFPLYSKVRQVAGWKTIPDLSSYCFIDELGEYMIVFLSDHCDVSGEWASTHGTVHGDPSKYPYGEDAYVSLRERIGSSGKRVITAGHYAFAGGNRPSPLLGPMLPLPDNVKIHFHGHAHIGDEKWAGKLCFQKMSVVEQQSVPQVNVSSLENDRGSAIRSVILEIYDDNSMGIYFRDHSRGDWSDMYFIQGDDQRR